MDFLKMAYNNYLKANPEIQKELYKEAAGEYDWILPAVGGLGLGGVGGYLAGKYMGQPAQPAQPTQPAPNQLTPEEEAYLMQQNYAYPYGY